MIDLGRPFRMPDITQRPSKIWHSRMPNLKILVPELSINISSAVPFRFFTVADAWRIEKYSYLCTGEAGTGKELRAQIIALKITIGYCVCMCKCSNRFFLQTLSRNKGRVDKK